MTHAALTQAVRDSLALSPVKSDRAEEARTKPKQVNP